MGDLAWISTATENVKLVVSFKRGTLPQMRITRK